MPPPRIPGPKTPPQVRRTGPKEPPGTRDPGVVGAQETQKTYEGGKFGTFHAGTRGEFRMDVDPKGVISEGEWRQRSQKTGPQDPQGRGAALDAAGRTPAQGTRS